MGDGSRLESGRAIDALGVQLPLLPPCALGRSAEVPAFQAGATNLRSVAGSIPAGHFDIDSQRSFGDRLTVGCLALNQAMEVQVLLPELGR